MLLSSAFNMRNHLKKASPYKLLSMHVWETFVPESGIENLCALKAQKIFLLSGELFTLKVLTIFLVKCLFFIAEIDTPTLKFYFWNQLNEDINKKLISWKKIFLQKCFWNYFHKTFNKNYPQKISKKKPPQFQQHFTFKATLIHTNPKSSLFSFYQLQSHPFARLTNSTTQRDEVNWLAWDQFVSSEFRLKAIYPQRCHHILICMCVCVQKLSLRATINIQLCWLEIIIRYSWVGHT